MLDTIIAVALGVCIALGVFFFIVPLFMAMRENPLPAPASSGVQVGALLRVIGRWLLAYAILIPIGLVITMGGEARADWSAVQVGDKVLASSPTTSPGIFVAVTFFSDDDTCDKAGLIVTGRGDITDMALNVDGDLWAGGVSGNIVNVEGMTLLPLSSGALRSIKNGQGAVLVTDKGSVYFDLKGSSRALMDAYAHCLVTQSATLRPMVQEDTRPMVPDAAPPTTSEYRF